jgi:hypothetical protein
MILHVEANYTSADLSGFKWYLFITEFGMTSEKTVIFIHLYVDSYLDIVKECSTFKGRHTFFDINNMPSFSLQTLIYRI